MESAHDAQIEAAIAHSNGQEIPNLTATAKSFGIHSSTLRRRYKGQTVSRAEANSTIH